MNYQKVHLEAVIHLHTALHIGTGLGLGQMVDALTVQGPHPEVGIRLPYVPGSSLKGRLRLHARQMSVALGWSHAERSTGEAHLFGFDQRPGSLVFADAHLDPVLARQVKETPDLRSLLVRSERSFVSLSRQRRVALEQRLFRVDLAERDLVFPLHITGHLPAPDAARHLGLLLAAMREVTHLGGHKSRGLGRCTLVIAAVQLDTYPVTWKTLVEQIG